MDAEEPSRLLSLCLAEMMEYLRKDVLSGGGADRIATKAADAADRRAVMLARSRDRRTDAIKAAIFCVVVSLTAVSAYWLGWSNAERPIAGLETAVAPRTAASALWLRLIAYNDVEQAVGRCVALKSDKGRRACSVPMWLDPPPATVPGSGQ
jgi:hypothetical protein